MNFKNQPMMLLGCMILASCTANEVQIQTCSVPIVESATIKDQGIIDGYYIVTQYEENEG